MILHKTNRDITYKIFNSPSLTSHTKLNLTEKEPRTTYLKGIPMSTNQSLRKTKL